MNRSSFVAGWSGISAPFRAASALTRAAAVLALTLCSSPASAFCRTTTCAALHAAPDCVRGADNCWAAGIPLYWPGSCTGYAVQEDGSPKLGISYDTMSELTASAFAHWPTAMCGDAFPSISVESLGAAVCDRLEYNPSGPNANVVMFRDQSWPHDPSYIALTTVSFDVNSGKILDADMEINSAQPVDASSLRYVVTHESGHFFGLDHTLDTSAVMFAHYTLPGPDAPDPVLTADDVAAICAAYPATRVAAACNFEPERGYSPVCGADVTGGCSASRPGHGRAGSAAVGMSALCVLGAALAFSRARRRGRSSSPER